MRREYQEDFKQRLYERSRPPRPPRPAYQPRVRDAAARGRWTPPPPPATAQAKAVQTGGIDRILGKAVLAGLIRHPAEIARHMEVLGSLRLADNALARLFEAVVDVALEDQTMQDQALDSARLVTILAKSGFDTIATELLRADQLALSFTQAHAAPDQAARDLDEAIAILVARPEVDQALADATAALQVDHSDGAFERQVALVQEQRALETRLANLVQAHEDARVLKTEEH